jgi:hypothetical protein
MNPGEVTRILVRWAPQDESPQFEFDATAEPGYVWHCHILEHEENDMMRPFHPVAAAAAAPVFPVALQAEPVRSVDPVPPSAVRITSEGSTVRLNLPVSGQVDLDLFNVSGQLVTRIASSWFEAGEHSLAVGSRSTSGTLIGAGVYFVRLRADDVTLSRKIVLAQ